MRCCQCIVCITLRPELVLEKHVDIRETGVMLISNGLVMCEVSSME